MHNGLAALADPTRQRIVELLSAGERAAGDIAARLPVSAPATSQHLKVLREARLVSVRVEGQRRVYALDADGFRAIDRWLEGVRRFWGERLDALERELRKPTRKSYGSKKTSKSRGKR
jgi:DNA-binding transcriptional ArsR family regulator